MMGFLWARLGWIGLGASLFLAFPMQVRSFDAIEQSDLAALQNRLQELRKAYSANPKTPELLIQLASAYLDAGDELYAESTRRIEAYQAGADFAKNALALDQRLAEAHFLYAANLGHLAQLKGVLISALFIREIKSHVEQALELDPHHAPALHMMGMMLDGLPWFLGGDAEGSMVYLERAVAADPAYTHARLNLGKLYLKHGRIQAAKEQLSLVVGAQFPRSMYVWSSRHKPEALRILKDLETPRVTVHSK